MRLRCQRLAARSGGSPSAGRVVSAYPAECLARASGTRCLPRMGVICAKLKGAGATTVAGAVLARQPFRG